MKRFLLLLGLVIALVSCAGLPKPESEGDSLVIGSLILDFPDGFFNLSPRKFDRSVRLLFWNTTQGESFTLSTAGGYFCFLTNGTDEYVLKTFEIKKMRIIDTIYSFGGDPIDFKISTVPDKVIYLGHILFTYTEAEFAKRKGETRYYNYESSVSVAWHRDAMVQYIEQAQKDSPWLDVKIVEYRKQK